MMFDSMINNIENKLNEELKEYHIKEAMMLNLKKNKDEEEEKLKKLELEIDNLKKVKILLQKTSQFAREQSKNKWNIL
ncbi:hypothetical protein [Caloramator sp. Dgby_cultured_2]|uniref:hypothetical protein n=1 Tax=Caloramator sp. Dgby_cultured_2 TaxID=3029174 RepID=UPI00237E53BB|nr:hypothetical protein [Caloramator sp. Dgby_cultured_2]WDU84014.1 hypothetical protein PWK10_06140 [Caloramator sp. Dgby_cultured_2]